jgi:hypothetical protein
MLIPKHHGFGTRRVPQETHYYEVYNQPNVELVSLLDTPIERITRNGLKTSDRELERLARGTFPLRSLPIPCSLRHGGSFGPGPADRVFWRTRFSGPPGSRRYSVVKFNSARDIPIFSPRPRFV